jgi:hypothetical protein
MRYALALVSVALAQPCHQAVAQTASVMAPEETEFRFAPSDGLRVQQIYRLTRVRTVEGRPAVRDQADATSEGTFKRSGDGYEYALRVVSTTMQRDGQTVTDPITALLAKLQATYVLSPAGEALEIKGYSELAALLQSSLPPQVAAAIAPVINETAMVNRDKAEWNGRYAGFSGVRFKIGDAFDSESSYPLPTGGQIIYKVRTTFAGWEPCPAGRCVRIEQVYDSDSAAMADLASAVAARVTEAASAPVASKVTSARISGALTRVVDPRTLLIHSERVQRTIRLLANVHGSGALPSTQEETRLYTYTYQGN